MNIENIIMSAFVSLIATGTASWFKSYFDSRNLNLSSSLKFKEIVFNQQIQYYEKFSEISWTLLTKISSFLNDNEKLEEVLKIRKSYTLAFAISQIGLPKNVINKMRNYEDKMSSLMDELPNFKTPLKVEDIKSVVIPVGDLRNEVIAAIKENLFIDK
ncbi:MAG: hypothetical protein ACD_59C00053G0012 [uncultured bacterium]|nr:MAG: hypothetical protein ACD_59C00053G0012 [uncultured bacterium]